MWKIERRGGSSSELQANHSGKLTFQLLKIWMTQVGFLKLFFKVRIASQPFYVSLIYTVLKNGKQQILYLICNGGRVLGLWILCKWLWANKNIAHDTRDWVQSENFLCSFCTWLCVIEAILVPPPLAQLVLSYELPSLFMKCLLCFHHFSSLTLLGEHKWHTECFPFCCPRILNNRFDKTS